MASFDKVKEMLVEKLGVAPEKVTLESEIIKDKIELFSKNKNATDYTFDVKDIDTVYIQVDKIFDASIRVYGSYSATSGTTLELNFVSAQSLLSHKVITTKGIYKIDCKGLNSIRFNKVQSNNAGEPVNATLLMQYIAPTLPQITNRSLNKLPTMTQVTAFNKTPIIHCLKNKWVYASTDNTIVVSKDYGGDNFSTVLYTFSNATVRIKRIEALNNGSFLILTNSGKLYKTIDKTIF